MSVTTSPTVSPQLEELAVNAIRVLSMDAVQKANSGHPGAPMGLAPFMYVLYTQVLRHDPADPHWPGRDRFVLSGGHACAVQYSLLHLCGYDMTLEDLKQFRQLDSRTPGHPEYGLTPGIEVTTGPLGQGIANAVGFAIAETRLAEMFNRGDEPIVNWHTYFECGDGDMQEGVQAEAASLAGSLGLGNLIGVYDSNHIQIEGSTDLAFHEDVAKRYESYGWHVQHLEIDCTPSGIREALENAKAVQDKPSLIVMRTHIACGSPNKQDTAAAHGAPLGADEIELTKKNLNYPSLEPFFVPDEVRELFADVPRRGAELHAAWSEQFSRYEEAEPELAADYWRIAHRGMPPKLKDAETPTHAPEEPGEAQATRSASGKALNWLKDLVPELNGGSADLAPSNETHMDDEGDYLRHQFDGRNLHFGVREHAMGAIVSGMVLCGLRAYGGTFLTFSDYMRGSIRLAALMEIPSLYVYTHDSIGLGEDGPTHQSIDQLPSLRALPNLHVVRPADVNETFQAWRWAVTHEDGPVAFAFTRQKVPVLDPDQIPADAVERGAYVYRDPSEPAKVILIGTGSEVSLCLEAAELLEQEGLPARVVSMPCVESFASQPSDYRDSVLPPDLKARVSVEMAATLGWERWIGDEGLAIGIDRFGASAPIKDLLPRFGFTPRQVADKVKERYG